MSNKIIEDIINNIWSKKNYNDMYKIVANTFLESKFKCVGKNCGKDLKILILNAPCNGFGDIIFGIKIARYLREWYNASVIIASTQTSQFITLGENPENLIKLTGGKAQCRRFANLQIEKDIPKQDLIFVAPVQFDFDANLPDVKKLIPYATKYNTYFFSEYNDSQNKKFDFPTGIGGKNLGLLMTSPKIKKGSPIKNPYAVIYVAETISSVKHCYFSFIEMVTTKYHQVHPVFDIVVPTWIVNNPNFYKEIVKYSGGYYENINIIGGKYPKKIKLSDRPNKTTLNIRGDILPLPYNDMLRLIKYSVKDILLTGDQSITDALSCCGSKNIFYQIAPWKENFGKHLALYLPNKFLAKKKTSCGTLLALKYDSNYKKFIQTWDFRKLARPKMDAIILAANARKNSSEIRELEKIILESRTITSLKNKLKN
jgi:hypothetical protein